MKCLCVCVCLCVRVAVCACVCVNVPRCAPSSSVLLVMYDLLSPVSLMASLMASDMTYSYHLTSSEVSWWNTSSSTHATLRVRGWSMAD